MTGSKLFKWTREIIFIIIKISRKSEHMEIGGLIL